MGSQTVAASPAVIPDLAQVNVSIPAFEPNQFLTGPFLEGPREGNILYAISALPASVELARVGRQGSLPPLTGNVNHFQGIEQELLNAMPASKRDRVQFRDFNKGALAIYAGNGMVYPFLGHIHEAFVFNEEDNRFEERLFALDANFIGNGPIMDNPGPTRCDFSRPLEGSGQMPAPPIILSTNRLFVPTVLTAGGIGISEDGAFFNGFCSTTGYVPNADFTLELTDNADGAHNAGPSEDVSFSFVSSTDHFDPVPPAALRRTEDFSITDPSTGDVFGAPSPFSNDFYVARGGPTGASAVWLDRRPGCLKHLEGQIFGGGSASADLEGPYMPPPDPDANRVLSLAGIIASGGARVLQTSDRFVLLSWSESGSDRWGSFKYAIYGKVVSPCADVLGEHVEIRAKHVQDGMGLFFELNDLEYPFSLADKKNPDTTIPLREDGSFSATGVLAGRYELTMFFDGKPAGSPVVVNVGDYKPAVFALPAMEGYENDQAYYSPAGGVIVNLSNGNLMLASTDMELVNVGPALGFTRVYNNLDITQELNSNGAVADAVPQPLGHGWTHNYNWMILKADPLVWDDGHRACLKEVTVILVDADGTRHTFFLPPGSEKKLSGDREVLEFQQQQNTGAEPMQLLMTGEKRFELTQKGGAKYIFDIVQGHNHIGHLTRIVDPNGNTLDLDYDAQARLTRVESSSTGRTLLFQYAPGTDLISQITDPQGRAFLYEYEFDASRPAETAKLIRATQPATAPVEYAYTAEPSIREMRQDCAVTTFLTDHCRRVIAVTPPTGKTTFAYEPSNDVKIFKTSIIDAAGALTAVNFDPWTRFDTNGQPVGGGRVKDVTDAQGKVTTFGWDEKGNLIQRIEANGHVITTDYDNLKNVVRRSQNTGSEPVTWTYPAGLPDFDPRRSRPTTVSGRELASERSTYDAAGNSVKTEEGDIATTIERNPDGTVSAIVDPDVGTIGSIYDRGNLTRHTTVTAATAFTYGSKDALGLPDKREGPDGQKLFLYDDAGRTTSAENKQVEICKDQPADLKTTTSYDVRGNAVEVSTHCQTVSMEYSCANQLTKRKRFASGFGLLEDLFFYDDRGLRTKERRADGLEVSYTHDNLRRLIAVTRGTAEPRTDTHDYDSVGNVVRSSNGVELRKNEYDLENRLVQEIRSLPGLSDLITKNVYNKFGLVSRETIKGSTPADPALVRTTTYDDLNRPAQVVTECGTRVFTENFTYEPGTGRMIRHTDGDYSAAYGFDEAGRVIEERNKNAVSNLEQIVKKEYDANENVVKLTVEGGCQPPLERRFNKLSWLLETKRGLKVESFCHDECGRVVERTDNLGGRISRIFNEEGWVLSETRNGGTTTFARDGAGRVIRQVNPDGSVREFVRNEHGDVVKEKIPGVSLRSGAPGREVVIDRTFDRLGNAISITRNGADLMTYRWSGPYLMGETDREKHVWIYTRDAFGHLTSISVDSALVMKFENDGCGHRLSATDAKGRTTRYKFDSKSRVVERVNADGTVIAQKYHGSGRLVEREIRAALGAVVGVERWDWCGGGDVGDGGGGGLDGGNISGAPASKFWTSLDKMENPDGSVRFEKDENGLLTGITFSGAVNSSLIYTTDADNDVTSVRVSGGVGACGQIRYEYNADKNVTKVVDDAGHVTTMEYDGNKREKKRTLPNGEVVEKEYNAAGWILKQEERIGGNKFVREWQYDAQGLAVAYLENNARFSYDYDSTDRLISATRPDKTKFQYFYDTQGNMVRISTQDVQIVQIYDSASQLLRREEIRFRRHEDRGQGNNVDHDDEDNPGKGKGGHGAKAGMDDDGEDDDEKIDNRVAKRKIFEYFHDANGRLISIRQVNKKGKLVKKNETTFAWDGMGRLIKAVKGDVTVDYTHDPEGRLLRRLERSKGLVKDDRRYVWDVTSENILAELDASGNVLACYTPTRTQDDVIVKENHVSNKTAIYSDFNKNLPTEIVRDEFGNKLEERDVIEPFGAILDPAAPTNVDHVRYMGKFRDEVTGFFYYRSRWYDAQARRFISPDPQPFDVFNPVTTNPYVAFGDNPVQNTDPSGKVLNAPTAIVLGGLAIGAAVLIERYIDFPINAGSADYTFIEDAIREIKDTALLWHEVSWKHESGLVSYYQQRAKSELFSSSGRLVFNDDFAFTSRPLHVASSQSADLVFVRWVFNKYKGSKKLAVILYHELIHTRENNYSEVDAWQGTAQINKALERPFTSDWIKAAAKSANVTIPDADL